MSVYFLPSEVHQFLIVALLLSHFISGIEESLSKAQIDVHSLTIVIKYYLYYLVFVVIMIVVILQIVSNSTLRKQQQHKTKSPVKEKKKQSLVKNIHN